MNSANAAGTLKRQGIHPAKSWKANSLLTSLRRITEPIDVVRGHHLMVIPLRHVTETVQLVGMR